MPREEGDAGGRLLSWLRGSTVPCHGRRGTLGEGCSPGSEGILCHAVGGGGCWGGEPSLSWALQNLKSLLFPWRHISVNCHTEVSREARVAWGVGSEEALIQSDHELALASCCV